MKKVLKKSVSVIVCFVMMLSMVTVFAAPAGVTGLTAKRNSNTLTLSWTNPTDEGFSYNEVYKTFKNETSLIATLKDGETSAQTDCTDGGHYQFKVKSVYSDGSAAEETINFLRSYQDTKTFEGWKLDVRDETYNNSAFRGDYEVSYSDAHSGISSAYFRIDHNIESNVYLQFFKDISVVAGKDYCISFWFKTNDYGILNPATGKNYRSKVTYVDPMSKKQTGIEIDDKYPNGQWHNYKVYFNEPAGNWSTGLASKQVSFIIDCYGEIWLDDIEVYEVDENKERVYKEDALDGFGTFEAERGVTSLSASRNGNNAKLTWKNPTNSDFERNEIYVKTPGADEKLLTVLTGGETTYTWENGVTDPNSYLFTVRSYYTESTTTVDKQVAIFRGATDSSAFPGWGVEVSDIRNTLSFRGGYDISFDEAKSGDSSAHFNLPHQTEDRVYLKLKRDFSLKAGEEYIYSFWFKTRNHVTGKASKFRYFNPGTEQQVTAAVGTDYSDGEWTQKETTFTASKDGVKTIYFTLDGYGDIYIDDVKLVRVSDNVNLLEKDGINYGDFEGIQSVAEFAYKSADTSTISLSWKNSSYSGFDKNELYLVTDGGRELIATFENGETSYDYAGTEAGARYDFVMVSYFGEKTKEASLTAYAKRNKTTTKLAPGWTIDYRDTNPERYRGKVGVSTSEAHSGNTSLFFTMEEPMQAYVYNKLLRLVNLEQGKTYAFSGWIKTEGYGDGAARFIANVAGTQYKYAMDLENKKINNPYTGEDEEFDNGEWYLFTIYYTADKTASKEFSLTMDSKGTIYVDDLELYQVEESDGEYIVVGDNLFAPSESKTGGDFEYEPEVILNVDAQGESANADAYIGNCFMMNADSKLYIAVYDGQNKLKYIDEKSWSECAPTDDKEVAPFEGNMAISAPYENGDIVKAFVWNGMNSMCEAAEY